MKVFALPVAVAAALLLTDPALAQSGIRYVAMAGGRPAGKPTSQPSPRLTSQVAVAEESSYAAGDIGTGGYVAGGGGVGYGAGGVSIYGYNPDFGIMPGGMSVWPGVPACCDPWLGYCGEPRCNHCSCRRGRYLYFRCNHDTCTPELVTWGGKCSKCNECGNGGTCAACGTCASCGNGPNMSYSGQPTSMPQPVAEPSAKAKVDTLPPSNSDDETTKKSPPRNKLPKISMPSALGKSDWFRK
ncbi:MAG TPA: hypothetical protein VHD36_10935 [Pirellulales bacterium]|nr:hypothetical protein [Pirellulales bacterium]